MAAVPLISVITPTHNRRDQVQRALQSVLEQTLGDFEYLIVDDGSTDGTEEVLSANTDPRVVYIKQPWRGANAARNAGIKRATAPLLTFLDSDDIYLPQRLERTVARFQAEPGLQLLISSFLTLKNGNLTRSVNKETFLNGADLDKALVAQTIYIAGSAITARREAILAVGGFDSEIARMQDRELLLRLARHHGAQLSEP
jgi:glycosyltransferase involved in cell wall biosynthesis